MSAGRESSGDERSEPPPPDTDARPGARLCPKREVRDEHDLHDPGDPEELAADLASFERLEEHFEAIVRAYRRLNYPKATQRVFQDPGLYDKLCAFCRNMANVLLDSEGRVVRVFCLRCCSVISEHPPNSCTGGTRLCAKTRFVDAIGVIAPLCSGCHQYSGGARPRPGRGSGRNLEARRRARDRGAEAAPKTSKMGASGASGFAAPGASPRSSEATPKAPGPSGCASRRRA